MVPSIDGRGNSSTTEQSLKHNYATLGSASAAPMFANITKLHILNCTTDKDVNGQTSVWLAWSDAVLGIVSAVTAGTFGGLSDSPRCGRNPVMLLSTLGLLASVGMNAIADLLDLSPLFLVFANVLNGFTGGYAVFLAMVFAYAADVSHPTPRDGMPAHSEVLVDGEPEIKPSLDSSTQSPLLPGKDKEGKNGPGLLNSVHHRRTKNTPELYATESTPAQQSRASSFSWVESMLYIGNIFGPLGMSRLVASGSRGRDGGVLLGLCAEAALGVLLFLYIAFVLPESLHLALEKGETSNSDNKHMGHTSLVSRGEGLSGDGTPLEDPVSSMENHASNSIHGKSTSRGENSMCGRRNNVISALAFLFMGRPLCSDTSVPERRSESLPRNTHMHRAKLSALFMLNFMLIIGFMRITFVYTELVFGWTTAFFDTFTAFGRGLPLAIGAWLLALIWSHPPRKIQNRLIRVATIFIAMRMIGCALAPSGTVFFSMGALNIIGGILSPLLRAGLSESATAAEQGLCLTGIAAIETVTGIWAPLMFGYIYSHTEPAHPELILWVFAGIAGIMIFISMSLTKGKGAD